MLYLPDIFSSDGGGGGGEISHRRRRRSRPREEDGGESSSGPGTAGGTGISAAARLRADREKALAKHREATSRITAAAAATTSDMKDLNQSPTRRPDWARRRRMRSPPAGSNGQAETAAERRRRLVRNRSLSPAKRAGIRRLKEKKVRLAYWRHHAFSFYRVENLEAREGSGSLSNHDALEQLRELRQRRGRSVSPAKRYSRDGETDETKGRRFNYNESPTRRRLFRGDSTFNASEASPARRSPKKVAPRRPRSRNSASEEDARHKVRR